jgi:hypothetical protein
MQKLHDTVYSVFERYESGIVTRYNICESGRESTVDGSDGLYKDWPIEVQVFDKSEETETVEISALEDVTAPLEPETKRKFSFLSRPFVKPAVAAAAVILIALLFNIPVAAVNLDQISKALEQVKNVYFATSDTTEDAVPTQEIWISQALNRKLYKTGAEYFLWDIKAKSKIKRDLNTGSITTIPLNTDVSLNVRETIRSLLPLNSKQEIPKGAQWLQVDEKDIVNPIAGTRVYDFIWTEEHLLGAVRKWRGHIDIETKRPKRIEWWIKLGQEQDFKCESVTEVSYPTTDDIKDVIEKAGF